MLILLVAGQNIKKVYVRQIIFFFEIVLPLASGISCSAPAGWLVNYFILCIFMMPIFGILIYLGRCDLHFLASLVPICSVHRSEHGETYWSHTHQNSFVVFILFVLMQHAFITVVIPATFAYITVSLSVIFDGRKMIEDFMYKFQVFSSKDSDIKS